MISRTLALRAAKAALVFLFLFVTSAGYAQIRQLHLYIDDGTGHFTILSSSGTGTLTLPTGTGTLMMEPLASPAGPGVILQGLTPGTQQTGNLNISGAGIFGGGLTVTGTIHTTDIEDVVGLTINTVLGKNTTIGNSTGTTSIAGSNWSVTNAGAATLTSITGLTTPLSIGQGGTGQSSFGAGVLTTNGTVLSSGAINLTNTAQVAVPPAGVLTSNGSAISSGAITLSNTSDVAVPPAGVLTSNGTAISSGAITLSNTSDVAVPPAGVLTSNGTAISSGAITLSNTAQVAVPPAGVLTSNGSAISSGAITLTNTAQVAVPPAGFIQSNGSAISSGAITLSDVAAPPAGVLTSNGSAISSGAITLSNTAQVAVPPAGVIQSNGSAISSGAISLSSSADVNGILPTANGGTGVNAASAGAAFNALSPMSALGDIIYGGASGAGTRLAGNTTTTKNFLTQTGDGTNSAAPVWGTISASDVPGVVVTAPGSAQTIIPTADVVPLTLRSDGSAHLQDWESSTPTVLAYVDNAGNINTTGSFEIGGAKYLQQNGHSSLAVGAASIGASETGDVFVGAQAGSVNDANGFNTAVGFQSGFSITTNAGSGGSDNVMVGTAAGAGVSYGSNNTIVGAFAGRFNLGNAVTLTTGSGDLLIGYSAAVPNNALTNASAIGSQAEVSASNSMVLGAINGLNGATSNTNVGIGTTTPSALFSVGTASALQVDVNGNLSTSGTITSTSTSGITSGANSNAGALLISDGGATAKYAKIVASGGMASTPQVFTLPSVGGTLATAGSFVVLTPAGAQTILPSAAVVPLTIEDFSSGSADLQDWESNTPSIVAFVDHAGDISTTGYLNLSSGTTPTTGIQNAGTTVFWNSTNDVFLGPGSGAALAGTTGLFNIGIGFNALHSLTAASASQDNTAMGREALLSLTGGGGANTAFGGDALRDITTSAGNTAFGNTALLTLGNGGGSGDYNTAVGYEAMEGSNNANYNTAVGYFALQLTSGTGNVALGFDAGYTSVSANANTSGNYNTYLGYKDGPATSTQYNESTAIGAFATVGESYAIVLGAVASTNGEPDGNTTKVGIGTTTPSALLSVGTSSALQVDASGNLSTSGTLTLPSATPTIIFGTSGNDRTLNFKDGDNNTLASIIDGGLTSQAEFEVSGLEADFINHGAVNNFVSFGSIVSMVGNPIVEIDRLTTYNNGSTPSAGISSATMGTFSFGTGSSDMAGQVTFTATTALANDYAEIKFNSAYPLGNVPFIVLTPADQTTALAVGTKGFYVTPFSDKFRITVATGTTGTYSFYYQVVGH